jgi:hypothetical protein
VEKTRPSCIVKKNGNVYYAVVTLVTSDGEYIECVFSLTARCPVADTSTAASAAFVSSSWSPSAPRATPSPSSSVVHLK